MKVIYSFLFFNTKITLKGQSYAKATGKGKKKPTVDVDRNIYSMLQKLKCNRNVNDLRGKHELNGEGSVMLHPEKIRMQGVCIYIYTFFPF